MVETFNNYKLLIMNETWDLLTMACVKLESRLYTRESEDGKGRGGGGGEWVSNEGQHSWGPSLLYERVLAQFVWLRTGL